MFSGFGRKRHFNRMSQANEHSSFVTSPCELPLAVLTHDTLAGLVGAARETTSSAVQQLRALGLIAGTRGRYLVLPHALKRYAEDGPAN